MIPTPEQNRKKIDYSVRENRKVELKITLDWDFPKGWDDELINFHLNESGFCLGNLLDKVNEYAEQHNGCICFISEAQVLPKENIEETEKEASQ